MRSRVFYAALVTTILIAAACGSDNEAGPDVTIQQATGGSQGHDPGEGDDDDTGTGGSGGGGSAGSAPGGADGGSADGAGGGDAGDPTGACIAYMGALCSKWRACEMGSVPGGAACESTLASRCPGAFFGQGSTETAAAVTSCSRDVLALSCDQFLGVVKGNDPTRQPACTAPGTLAKGAACGTDYQCASFYCHAAGATPLCGTCDDPPGAPPAPGKKGDPCTNGCAQGLACGGTPAHCVAVVGVGAHCDDGNATEPIYCGSGEYCDLNAFVCVHWGEEGQTCSFNFQQGGASISCDYDLNCVVTSEGSDEDVGTCKKAPDVGGTCGIVKTNSIGSLIDCNPDTAYCPVIGQGAVEGTCGSLPAAGQPCHDFSNGYVACVKGTTCDASKTCVGPAQSGKPCGAIGYKNAAIACDAGLHCEQTQGGAACAPDSVTVGQGQSCDDTHLCPPWSTCAGGICGAFDPDACQ